jgi:hypothetical protein
LFELFLISERVAVFLCSDEEILYTNKRLVAALPWSEYSELWSAPALLKKTRCHVTNIVVIFGAGLQSTSVYHMAGSSPMSHFQQEV